MNGQASRRRAWGKRQSGQAAVESALTLPLFVFVLLGTLQLALMHQARLMTKYAAYKAVRVGAITSVDMTRMERAALAVLLPTIKAQRAVFKASSGGEYLGSLPFVLPNFMPDAALKYVEVDFDAESATGTALGRRPKGDLTAQGWKDFDRGRLVIQLTFNYRMPIPFADMMLYYIATNQERADLMRTFRLGKQEPMAASQIAEAAKYNLAAAMGQYVLPIRANYVMRMQSSLFPNASGHELPQDNKCVVRFPKSGGGGGGATTDNTDDDTEPEDP
jgi:TadE-like protein